jgi:hypothetical protein
MKRLTVKQFRGILVHALKEFLDGGEPFQIIEGPNGFFYADSYGNSLMVHIVCAGFTAEELRQFDKYMKNARKKK